MKILVAGIGNIFHGDDAFGVEVANRLQRRHLPAEIRVVDFGIRGFDLAYALLDGHDLTILVDATPRGGAPGSLYTIEIDPKSQTQPRGQEPAMGGHGMNPMRVLQLAQSMGGITGRLLLVGCEPETLGSDEEGLMGLSVTVESAVESAGDLVVELARKFLAENREASDSGAAA